jgi:uncharacterized protein
VLLTPDQVRVLGCLIEKEATTPQSYPLTLNALRLACNQSTSRDPVTDLGDHQIESALSHLRELGLIRIVYSPSNRAAKYRHVVNEMWDLHQPELAVLSVLMLRGPQTPGELKARTERQHRFVELADLEGALERLANHQPESLVVRLARVPGQKETRYATTLLERAAATASGGGAATPDADPAPAPPTEDADTGLAAEVARLRTDLTQLRDEFDAFRDAFG